MQLNGPLMWTMWPQRGKDKLHICGIWLMCAWTDIRLLVRESKKEKVFLRGACGNQCLNCQMQDILWGPHSVKLSSEAAIYLVNQCLGQKLFFPENSVGSNGSWQKTSVKCWNDSSLHKPRAYATDLIFEFLSLSEFPDAGNNGINRFSQASPLVPTHLSASWYS